MGFTSLAHSSHGLYISFARAHAADKLASKVGSPTFRYCQLETVEWSPALKFLELIVIEGKKRP
jgi:hypothetical protein